MSRTTLALRVLRLKLDGAQADPTPDYDIAAESYDDYFTQVMGPHSVALLDRVRIDPGMSVIELACGTGHLTAEIARRLEGQGRLSACDRSAGMLEQAQSKVVAGPRLALTFREGDMSEFLSGQPDKSADLIVIGWAICYSEPITLLRDVRRILRPGGQVAVIDTRANALASLRHAFEKVVADDPTFLKALIDVNLPRSSGTLRRWFNRAGLSVDAVWDGSQERVFTTAEEAVTWLERSGAGAGFRDSFDAHRTEAVRTHLAAELARRRQNGVLVVQHTFVAGIAVNNT